MFQALLIIVFIAYIAQMILSSLQIKRSYAIINSLKSKYKGKNYFLATGTGKRRFFILTRGFFTILLVDSNEIIFDYYCMQGMTVFATPKQDSSFIGLTLDQAQERMTKTNQINSFNAAREQIHLLYQQAGLEEADSIESQAKYEEN